MDLVWGFGKIGVVVVGFGGDDYYWCYYLKVFVCLVGAAAGKSW